MPATYTLISSNVLSSSAASITFSSIPATYTDLVLRICARTDQTGTPTSYCRLTFNGSSSSVYSETVLDNQGSSVYSNRFSNRAYIGLNNTLYLPGPTATSNTYGSAEIYIPSYTASQNKSLSTLFVQENNSTSLFAMASEAALFRDSSAISSITLLSTDGTSNFVSGSSFYLYGISNS